MEYIDYIIIFAAIGLFHYFIKILLDYRKSLSYTPVQQQLLQMPHTDMTLKELSEYDGIKKQFTLIAIKNVILDVSTSEFYGPDGSYRLFVGKDISVALAKSSFQSGFFNIYNQTDLTIQEEKTLNDWYERLSSKYPIVGQIIDKKNQ